MILNKLQELLDNRAIKYTVISHSQAFTAQEIAETVHLPGKEIAKTVIVKVDGVPTMIVVPASDLVDFKLLKVLTGSTNVELAGEIEFKKLFPDCEIGAMPPFGSLFGLDVIVGEDLSTEQDIVFNAGTHRELIKMRYMDFADIERPKVMNVSTRRKHSIFDTWKYT